MSFKNLNDGYRRRALVPFLEATEFLNGHVVAVAVTKDMAHLSTGPTTIDLCRRPHGLRANWDPKSFEEMVRISHFFSLFVAAWSSPGMHISWVTDNDSIVANDERLDDTHRFAARLSRLCVPHRLGEFMMNTVSIDTEDRGFEDFVAIPDLAAGMLAEVVSGTSTKDAARNIKIFEAQKLSDKSDIIADWFWYPSGSLKKTCILIDRVDASTSFVGELRMGH